MSVCWRVLFAWRACVLLDAARSSLLQRQAYRSAAPARDELPGQVVESPVEPAEYNLRICNAYAYSQPLEVHHLRSERHLATLEYKQCAEPRVEIGDFEHFDFRLPHMTRDIVEEFGLHDSFAEAERKLMLAFNASDITRDGFLTLEEYISMQEFLHPWNIADLEYHKKRCRREFKALDANNDGKASIEELGDYEVFGAVSNVGEYLIGTFVLEQDSSHRLPDPDALETLLLLVVHRGAGEEPGSYLSAQFVSHAFGPEDLKGMGTNAIFCVMNLFKNRVERNESLFLAYDEKPNGTNFSHRHEMLEYDTVVGIHEGNYQISIGRSYAEGVHKEQMYARPMVNYAIIRIGDNSTESESQDLYPDELLVFPSPEEAASVRQGGATTTELALFCGFSVFLIDIAICLVFCDRTPKFEGEQ